MDFFSLLVIYCIVFIAGALCLLYRDAPVLNSGPLATVRHFLAESFSLIFPTSLQNGLFYLARHLFYSRTCVFQLIYIVLCILCHLVWVIDMLPVLYRHRPHDNHVFWPIAAVFINYIFWHMAWTGDPGVINERNVANLSKVYHHDNILYIEDKQCSTCKLPKPARSKHCSICNRCVHRFDHHCIWTNNCVGALNHRYFILFMFSMLAGFVQAVYVSTWSLLYFAEDIKLFEASYVDDDGSVKPMNFPVAIQHLFMAVPRMVFILLAVIVIFILVLVFFCHHGYLILTNQTTNERHKLQELSHHASDTTQSQNTPSHHDNKKTNHQSRKSNSSHSARTKLKPTNSTFNANSNIELMNRNVRYRPYSRGTWNNFLEVFLPHNFIMSKLKQK